MDAVPLVGKMVNTACAAAGMARLDCYQVEVCVVEAVNNSIKHGYRNESGHEVEIGISVLANRVTFEIIDRGTGGDPAQFLSDQTKRLELDPANLDGIPESGRGIAIIQAVMDGISYETLDGVNRLTMTKNVSNATEVSG